MAGWIKLHRKIKLWEWYDHAPTRMIFIHLLLSVNHEKKMWKGLEILPGQDVFSRVSLAKETGFSEQQVRTALRHLQSSGDIKIESNIRFSIISILKWSDYQDVQNTENVEKINPHINHSSNVKSTRKSTSNQPTNQPPINLPKSSTAKESRKEATRNQPINQPQINLQINPESTHQSTNESTTPKEIKKKEEKKKEFLNNLNLNATGRNLSESSLNEFLRYWVAETVSQNQSSAGEPVLMRFEMLPFFDFHKQLDLWEKNETMFNSKSKTNGNKRTEAYDDRKRLALEQLAREGK